MLVSRITYVRPGTDSYPEARCSGVRTTLTGRVRRCGEAATWWRVLVLFDDAEVPKAVCDEHREVDAVKWTVGIALS